MATQITLRGITWNHSRGFTPLVATAQRFAELNPGVEIVWEKRSLQAFADQPVDALAASHDLLVLDHPWIGFAAQRRVVLALDELLPADFLEDQRANAVGASHASYGWQENQWALAIDAAAPVASFRPDLIEKHRLRLPQTWEELLELARAGWVLLPGIAIDSLMNFFMLCSTLGEDVCRGRDRLVAPDIGVRALRLLRELVHLVDANIFSWNPIQVYHAMTETDRFAYCPFAYGYSNYSRRGYARRLLLFEDLVTLDGSRLRSTLGGTGLAISAHCSHPDLAARYAQYVASGEIQRSLYVDAGGQPGHRSAWLDDHANFLTADFFRRTLPALDRAYLRPRYDGYLHLQDHAGEVIRDYLFRGGHERSVLERLDTLYQESLEMAGS
jgi:multiple sugar transport system substrate-binding protein